MLMRVYTDHSKSSTASSTAVGVMFVVVVVYSSLQHQYSSSLQKSSSDYSSLQHQPQPQFTGVHISVLVQFTASSTATVYRRITALGLPSNLS
ncbi:hypothetical protein Hamer_G018158 [Homarus americanus]|uniref:Uncharacterized protein n=1 Tax=Homarus americanus TaxID=6706 RepID=A0A8J5JHJ2_HOMAM|nr:hypothetical protein Hamer_G018158 [Homarus americanus]